jgi:hypothetical protein
VDSDDVYGVEPAALHKQTRILQICEVIQFFISFKVKIIQKF